MGFTEEYMALQKKKLKQQEHKLDKKASDKTYKEVYDELELQRSRNYLTMDAGSTVGGNGEEVFRVPKAHFPVMAAKADNPDTWFTAGAFDDGYDFGDVTRTILGTGTEFVDNALAGIAEMPENIIDAGAYVAGAVGGLVSEDFADSMKEFIQEDLIPSEEVGGVLGWVNPLKWGNELVNDGDAEKYSLLGNKAEGLIQSGGQLAGTIGLQLAGVPWWLTTGTTSFGAEAENAFNQGANYTEAGVSAAVSAGAEILTEKLFGGSGLGEKGFANLDKLTNGISDKLVKTLADYGVDMGAEGLEEVVSSVANRFASSVYKEENPWELLTNEEALQEYLDAFIGGAALSGVINTSKVAGSVKNKRDYRNGLTAAEQKVFDSEYRERVSKAGEGVTKKEKRKLYDETMQDVQKGYVTSDNIKKILGEDSYKAYENAFSNEKSIRAEYEALAEKETLDSAEEARFNELKGKIELLNDSYIGSAFAEQRRREEAFKADLSQYTDENARKTVENAIKYGMHNGTDAHEFVDFAAKLAAKKGYVVDFTNTAKLQDSIKNGNEYGITANAKDVEAFVDESGKKIVVNMDSNRSYRSLIGHEITHTLETAKAYKEMQKYLIEYAKQKGDYDIRLADVERRYKGVKSDADAELTADLAGDYLLEDYDFIQKLLADDRNVFQRVYDEIKYMLKLATAGSKEARALEKAKHYYEKALQEESKIAPSVSLARENEQTYGNRSTPVLEFQLPGAEPITEDIAPTAEPVSENTSKNETAKKAYSSGAPKKSPAVLEAIQTELAENREILETAIATYDSKIEELQKQYDSKKRKDTKVAQDLLARIAKYKRIRDTRTAELSEKISKLETREKLAREGKPTTRQEVEAEKLSTIEKALEDNGYKLDDVLKGAKNLPTFSTVDNTPQRVNEKTFGYEAGRIINDVTFDKIARDESKGIEWQNSITGRENSLLSDLFKQYKIKPRSKESAAAQIFGEGFYAEDDGTLVKYGLEELAKDFPDANTRARIIGLAGDARVRKFYDDSLDAINEQRTRNGYPEIPHRDDYYLHFRAMEDTFSKLGFPFNPNDIKAKDLPTDVNGMTADLKPGKPFFASEKRRRGYKTTYDLMGGIERYASSAKNQIFHIDNIQTLRALRNKVADTFGQANGFDGIDLLTEAEQRKRIEEVLGSHLSNYAKFLNEAANILAGKTALIDRGSEGVIGRRGLAFMNSLNKQVGANMVGYNVSSSLTNFIAGVQAIAKTDKASVLKSFAQTASSKFREMAGRKDTFAKEDAFLTRRKGAERFHRTLWQKLGDAGYVLAGAVDNVTSEFVVRAKYNEFIKKGMSEQQAIKEADKWAAKLMGDRSLGQMPLLYNSKALGLVTKFQLEVRNQLDSQFYDTIQEEKANAKDIESNLKRNAKIAAKVTKTFVELAVLQHLFGVAFESVAGYNPAFDIISVLSTMFGFDDEEESEDTALDNVRQGFLELLEDLPYTSVITGGRIPISSALPIEEVFTGKDKYGNEKPWLETIAWALPYYFLPGGYGQIKKTAQGLSMFYDDLPVTGSYTDSGNLRFPVEDTFANKLQAAIFGQWASENARNYFNNKRSPLRENQVEEYAESEMSIEDYWEYREGLSKLDTLAEKADYIYDLDIDTWQKNLLLNNIANREKDLDMSDYEDYDSFEEFDFASNNPEKYNFIKENGISYQQYARSQEVQNGAYYWSQKDKSDYDLWKAVPDFKKYAKTINGISSNKDSEGNSISGSRKENVIKYIDGLNINYGEKILLYKREFPSDNRYNADILDYLNSREDLSYDDIASILGELGFTVHDNGYVEW